MSIRFLGRLGAAVVLGLLASGAATATDFAATGTVTLNGHVATLPSGSAFTGSSYSTASGDIGDGQFVVPAGSQSFDLGFATADVTYSLVQTNTSSGLVGADAVAVLTTATFTFTVSAMDINGAPVNLGNCTYGPFDVELAGTASAAALVLDDDNITVPPVTGANDCGGATFQSLLNQYLAGQGSVHMELAGDFTPPADTDLIFANGFDPAP